MELLACGHLARRGGRLCRHLLAEDAEVGQVKVLAGVGVEHDRICVDCDADDLAGRPVELVEACVGCTDRAALNDDGDGRWRGWAAVRSRPTAVTAQRLGAVDIGPDPAVPVAPSRVGWFVLNGPVVRRHGPDGSHEVGEFPALPAERSDRDHHKIPRRRLHASHDGSAVALVVDHGRYGAVMDCATGRVVLDLDRGDHYVWETPFPCAFTEHDGTTVLVVATTPHRVDAFALPGGRLLTPHRSAANGGVGRFHGALAVSPDGGRILDDSWLWGGAGRPAQWDLRRWLDGDGGQVREPAWLAQRWYLWDAPMCWVGDGHVVRWGVGDDDLEMLPGAVLIPIGPGGREVSFAGVPRGAFSSDGRVLHVVGDTGLTVWDPFRGERLAELVGLKPIGYSPFADEFLVRAGTGRAERVRLTVEGATGPTSDRSPVAGVTG